MDPSEEAEQAGAFSLQETVLMLERTPATLRALLTGLPDRWLDATEGEGTWSPRSVLGHLVHTERTSWIPRAQHILAGDGQPFAPVDRTAHLAAAEPPDMAALLEEFTLARRENLASLAGMRLTSDDLDRTGSHPALGKVRLGQLLATWAVHDLTHLVQIVRTMAKVYGTAVGPWSAYLSVLRDRE